MWKRDKIFGLCPIQIHGQENPNFFFNLLSFGDNLLHRGSRQNTAGYLHKTFEGKMTQNRQIRDWDPVLVDLKYSLLSIISPIAYQRLNPALDLHPWYNGKDFNSSYHICVQLTIFIGSH